MADEDKFAKGRYVEGFARSASIFSKSKDKSQEVPTGRQVYEAGFTTEKSLTYEATLKQQHLQPEPSPDDPEGWANAKKKARDEQSNKYWNFRDVSVKFAMNLLILV